MDEVLKRMRSGVWKTETSSLSRSGRADGGLGMHGGDRDDG